MNLLYSTCLNYDKNSDRTSQIHSPVILSVAKLTIKDFI